MSVHEAAAMETGTHQATRWSIRRCSQDDADTLAQVGAATFLESYAGWLPGRDILAHCRAHHSVDAYRNLLSAPETRAWVAEVYDAPVGYTLLAKPEMPPKLIAPRDLELKRIYLFSRLHGSGMANALLQEALAEAHAQGAERLLVGVHRDNRRALRFYARHGFHEIGRRAFHMGQVPYDDPVLSRSLAP